MTVYDSQVAYGVESTPGTRQAPTRRVEHVSFTPVFDAAIITGKGMKAGSRTARRHETGARNPGFQASHELSAASADALIQQALGAVATTGTDPYSHAFTPGALVATKALTVEAAVPRDSGTADIYSFLGCQLVSGSLSAKVGTEYAMISYTAAAMAMEDPNTRTASSASYPSAHSPFSWLDAVVTVGGTEFPLTAWELSFTTGIKTGRHRMRSTTPQNPLVAAEDQFRTFGIKLDSDYFGPDEIERFLDGTEAAVVITLGASSSDRITITTNAYFVKPTGADVKGPGASSLSQSAVMHSLTSDAAAITITVENANSAIT